MPKTDVAWLVTPSGQLIVSWLQKISEYRDDQPVTLTLREKTTNRTIEVTGRAKEVTVPSLKLGNEYEMLLREEEGEDGTVVGPINFEACELFMRSITKTLVIRSEAVLIKMPFKRIS